MYTSMHCVCVMRQPTVSVHPIVSGLTSVAGEMEGVIIILS